MIRKTNQQESGLGLFSVSLTGAPGGTRSFSVCRNHSERDRARDPRDYVLASFGGAGPMHACFVAQAMNVPTVLVPAHAGVASAFGAIAMNLRHDLESFLYAALDSIDTGQLNASYDALEARGRALLAADGIAEAEMVLTRTAQMRYEGQTFEVECDIPSQRIFLIVGVLGLAATILFYWKVRRHIHKPEWQ